MMPLQYIGTSPNGIQRDQIDCITGTRRWKSSIIKSKSWPGTGSGSQVKLKRRNKVVPSYDFKPIVTVFKIKSKED